MIHSEMKVGVRVKCVHLHCGHAGKYGTIISVSNDVVSQFDNCFDYLIRFDGRPDPVTFGSAASFELAIPTIAEYQVFMANILAEPIKATGHFCEPGQKHCHQCHRANNIGVSVCWNCATLDPCPTNLK